MFKLCKKRGQKITTLATFETLAEAREALIEASDPSKKRTGLYIQYTEADWVNDFLVFENI